jgi:PAS domain S-box-containing protein
MTTPAATPPQFRWQTAIAKLAALIHDVSNRWKLTLLTVGLLGVVTLAASLAAYRAMHSATLAATSEHLDGIASQWARLFESGSASQRAALNAAAGAAETRAFLTRPNARTRAAAAAKLASLIPAGRHSAVQLVDGAGAEILSVGRVQTPNRVASLALRTAAATLDSGVVGPLRSVGGVIVSTTGSRIAIDGAVRGYLMQTTQLELTPSPDVLNRLFGGGATYVRLANRDGSLWSDLATRIPAPAIDLTHVAGFTSYTSPIMGPVFASVRPIAATPWMFVLESSQEEVVTQKRRFLRGRLIEGALVLLFGALGAIVISTSLTKPLARLTEAVDAIGAGDYSQRLALPARGDEIGRLAHRFDEMAMHLQESFAAQRDAEEYYRQLFGSVPLPVWVFDRETLRFLDVNETAIAHYGYSRNEFLSMTLAEVRPPEEVPRLKAAIARSADGYASGEGWRHLKKDGTLIDVETNSRAIEFDGRPALITVVHDVTERRRAESELRRDRERVQRYFDTTDVIVLALDSKGSITLINRKGCDLLGWTESELLGRNWIATCLPPSRRAEATEKLADAKSAEPWKTENFVLTRSGEERLIEWHTSVLHDADGRVADVFTSGTDVTDRRKLQQQYDHAQKMEAVGRLAGGVAHDFNNLLTVILSYSDFLLADFAPDDPRRKDVEAIQGAGVSASMLTRQLLAFSRQQVIQPKVMRVDELIASSASMLKRLIGEDVELATSLHAGTGAVKVDPGQLEQIVMNLAINARDAMPEGGRLLIESKNVDFDQGYSEDTSDRPAGRYVLLAVSDNGSGMDAETKARVFEPFFTTKGPGKGTGLGLATVYGIVKQSGGFISLYSEPGNGTSFKIYFPLIDEAPVTPDQAVAKPAPRGTETILVAEDEAAVRSILRLVLERQGYRVLEAPDGERALDIAARHEGPIDLLVTDVVMPRLSGRIVADRFWAIRPGARVLFTSGYTDDAIVHHGVIEAGMQFLQKPYTPDALVRRVREVLDGGWIGPLETEAAAGEPSV